MKLISRMKRTKTILVMFLAVLMMMCNPMQILAANPAKEYVSEVRISTAKTAEQAKKWLTDNGYKVQDKDLNEGTTEQPVYLGYKTTNDPKEAITDMAVMDMKGGYSFSDYEELIKEKKKAITKQVEGIRKSIDEFVANYKAGSPAAKWAYEYMNQFKEDDSKMKMGDYLLDSNLSNEDLAKCFLQGNATIFGVIEYALAIGCADYKKDNWLKRLSDMGAEELTAKYDEKARKIYAVWDDFRQILLSYKEEKVKLTSSAKKVENLMDEMSTTEQVQYFRGGVSYELLSQYEYDGEPMVDFFLRDKNDLDMDELYPMAKALTDGQLEMLSIIGINALLNGASSKKSDWDNVRKEYSIDVKPGKEVSIYDGVDRSLYDGGVALTTEALRKSSCTGDNSWIEAPMSNTVWSIIAGIGIAGMLVESALLLTIMSGGSVIVDTAGVTGAQATIAALEAAGYHGIQYGATFSTALKYGALVPALAYVAIGVTLIVASIFLGMKLYNYYHPDFTEIPRIIVDEVKGEDETDKTYIKYYAVKDQDGKYADLNAWEAKQWNALYTSKDKEAGDPITTDMLVQNGNNVAEGDYAGVHAFGETAAFNLNKHCYTNKVNGIYFFFNRDADAFNYTGSVFGFGGIALAVGCGAVAGILLGSVGVMLWERRKKKEVLA